MGLGRSREDVNDILVVRGIDCAASGRIDTEPANPVLVFVAGSPDGGRIRRRAG